MAQEEPPVQDSIVNQFKFGLRIGADLIKLGRSFYDDNYSGGEINGDYRLSKNLYVAGELGLEEKINDEDYHQSTTKGNYLKAGFDYNLYTNWSGMENLVFFGFRVGTSKFDQTLNELTIYDTNSQTWGQAYIQNTSNFDGLTAIWSEFQLGFKAELLNNLFLGINLQLKTLWSQEEPDNFENLFIPGFGRTYNGGRIGVGYGYQLSYLIPLYKKSK